MRSFLPAIELVQEDLHTTNDLIAATVSIFIVFQGWTPLLWSSFSEIFGRKKCYLASNALYLAGTIALSRCDSIGLFIGMRVLRKTTSTLQLVASGEVLTRRLVCRGDWVKCGACARGRNPERHVRRTRARYKARHLLRRPTAR